MHSVELMEISDVQHVAALVTDGYPVPDAVVHPAQDTVRAMCYRASEYGLSTAEVLKAVLRPAVVKRRGCQCATCAARCNKANIAWRVVGVYAGN